jgi:putative transposase
MTQIRRVAPGRIYLVTRRTVRRTFLFRPEPLVNRFYIYTLAVYARRYGIAVHAAVLMSNHEHLIVTDTEGRLPDFLRDFHRIVALGIKTIRNWQGEVWDGAATSCVELCTHKAIIEKLAYVMSNPVKAGLVTNAGQWPGVMVLPDDLGTRSWAETRPDLFFDPRNPLWPSVAELKLILPRHCLTDDEFRKAVAQELSVLQKIASGDFRARNMRVMGRARALRVSPQGIARTPEVQKTKSAPALAVGRGQSAMLKEALAALRQFRQKYRLALQKWRDGLRNTLFPQHTWQMRWLHQVAIEPASA